MSGELSHLLKCLYTSIMIKVGSQKSILENRGDWKLQAQQWVVEIRILSILLGQSSHQD